jgi:hypothetical protein
MSFFTIKPMQLTTALLNKVQINNSHILLAKMDQQRWMSLSCLAPNNNCRPFHDRKLVLCESILPSPTMEWCEIYFSISSRFHVFHIVHTYLKLSQIVHTYSYSPGDNRLPTDCYRQFVSSYRLLQTVCVFLQTVTDTLCLPTDCYRQFVSSYRLLQTVCVFLQTVTDTLCLPTVCYRQFVYSYSLLQTICVFLQTVTDTLCLPTVCYRQFVSS